MFDPDAEWIEAPERVDARTYRGHDGIRESFEHWLAHWGEYRVEAERFEDHDEHVLVVAPEYGEGHGSGALTDVRVERTNAGLIERDRDSGRVLGLEFWNARERLPQELLDALPSPPAREVVVERQPA